MTEYTPTTKEVREVYRKYGRIDGPMHSQDRLREFHRWYESEIAAAEKRGAIAAQLCLDDDSMIRHDRTDNFPCTKCFEKAGRAIRNSADQIEQENNDDDSAEG